ncbi:YbjN domain-containing protein [Orrella sp. 11846]|uniref:YbjN domain-containing protein n=1 Tax=Orrella sp. 11846 TaxID=3409913 RepID=UPI003B5CC776
MNRGSSLQFYAGFTMDKVSSRKLNEWNANRRYSRTYTDDDGDPVIELDLDLEGGVSQARILDFLKTAQISFGYWRQEVVGE